MSSDDDSLAVATEVFSAIAAAGNIILFASQIPLMWRLIRVDGDSTHYDWLPSLTMMTTMSLWCGYTQFYLNSPQLYAANFPGMILPFLYLTIFVIYSKDNSRRMRIAGATLLSIAVTWGFSAGVFLGGVANPTTVSGGVTAAVNISFFVSPLRQLYRSVRELDLSRVPVLLSVVQFWQSLAWIIAAALLDDGFILGVNSAGFGFAILQLSVVFYVRRVRRRLGMNGPEAKEAGGGATVSPAPGVADEAGSADSTSPQAETVVRVAAAAAAEERQELQAGEAAGASAAASEDTGPSGGADGGQQE
jgi:hypothetical protein